MSLTRSGTGLRADSGPPGLKLSTSLFTTKPDEELAVVDAYEVQSSTVINSISDETGAEGGFFDGIKNAIGGGLSSLGGMLPTLPTLPSLGGLAAMAKNPIGMLRAGTGALAQISGLASRAMSAVNQVKNGGVMGTISGISSLSGMAGVAGAGQLASMARGVSYGINQGGVQGLLRAGGSVLGNQGGSLNQLASNINSAVRLGSYAKSASSRGGLYGLTSTLSAVDSGLSLTTSTLSSLDRASQINFQTGFDSVMNKSSVTSRSYNQSALGRVDTAVGDFSSLWSGDNVRQPTSTRAGTLTGLAMVGSGLGNNSIYSQVRSAGVDDDTAFLAGSALATHSAQSGNLYLLHDLTSDPIGLKAVSSNPYALASTVSRLAPDTSSTRKPLAAVYDDIDQVSSSTQQSWRLATRGGNTIPDITAYDESDYAKTVVQSKAASDDAYARRSQPIINPRSASISEAQAMSAVSFYKERSTTPKDDWSGSSDDKWSGSNDTWSGGSAKWSGSSPSNEW